MSFKKYDLISHDLQETIVGIFGTRQHAYVKLRLEEVGVPMPEFYRFWRHGRLTLVLWQMLSEMIDIWWRNRPDSLEAFARYQAPFSREMITNWARNIQKESR